MAADWVATTRRRRAPSRLTRQQIDLRGVGRIALFSAGVRMRNLLSRSRARWPHV